MPECKVCGKNGGGKIGYCREHLPDEYRCIATTRKGTRCTDRKIGDIDYCHLHNPNGRFAKQHAHITTCKACSRRAYGKTGYCKEHMPQELRCTATTKRGKPCWMPKMPDEDVCKVHLRRRKKRETAEHKVEQAGWVYVFDTNFTVKGGRIYKIGYTTQKVTKRERALQAANPYGRVLLAAYVRGVRQVEEDVHNQVRRYRVQRELFKLPMDKVREVRDYLEPLLIDGRVHGEWEI